MALLAWSWTRHTDPRSLAVLVRLLDQFTALSLSSSTLTSGSSSSSSCSGSGASASHLKIRGRVRRVRLVRSGLAHIPSCPRLSPTNTIAFSGFGWTIMLYTLSWVIFLLPRSSMSLNASRRRLSSAVWRDLLSVRWSERSGEGRDVGLRDSSVRACSCGKDPGISEIDYRTLEMDAPDPRPSPLPRTRPPASG